MPKKSGNKGIDFKMVKRWAGLAALVLIAMYGLYEARNVIEGPVISLSTPANGTLSIREIVEISGNTKNISYISLNDKEINIDGSGHFSEEVVLSAGYNPVKVYAKDRFGRETTSIVQVMYKDTTSVDITQLTDTNSQNGQKN